MFKIAVLTQRCSEKFCALEYCEHHCESAKVLFLLFVWNIDIVPLKGSVLLYECVHMLSLIVWENKISELYSGKRFCMIFPPVNKSSSDSATVQYFAGGPINNRGWPLRVRGGWGSEGGLAALLPIIAFWYIQLYCLKYNICTIYVMYNSIEYNTSPPHKYWMFRTFF